MSNVETLSGLQRRLNASIPQQQLRGEMEARLKRIGRTAKVHGFRPGKVPYKVLEQQYGPSVQQEVLGESLQRTFADAAVTNKLQVAGYPQFEIKTADLNAPQIEFSATFEVYPEVVLREISGESVNRVVFTLGDADVEETINTLRKQRAEFKKTDRAAQNGDQVRIDFSGKLNDVVFEGGEGKDLALVLGAGRMLPDFEKAILGMKAGETKSFDMTFPADYHGKEVAGKQVTFTITVHAVEEAHLPEVDAEFAKSLGADDGDVEKLKQEIRENVGREAERRVKVRNKDNAMEVLLKIAQLEVPKALLESEAQNLMQQTLQDMEARGMKIPKGMQLPPDMFVERATKRVKLGLILAELVKKHDLKAKPEQMKALVQEYAQSYEHPEEVVRWYAAEPGRMREVENLVLEDNVVAWVMAGAKVSDQAVTLNELMGSN
ncbi:trigger factor [Sideroxydans sp. CL21]|uniref:trigger factor n=1 Tax=Sideroxydans sp. CL21 TaxID=2600596 RepID=UPI0012A793D1|nr:trigger factor [Sideroxydans sp. CL21]VVC83640.1 Cell division trigger factor (EC 5.2.1.8) [Sideroxydans sp. CL21]